MLPRSTVLAAALFACGLAGQTSYGGAWAITPAAQYSCFFGIVQFSVNRIQITDNNPLVTIVLQPTFGAGTLSGTFPTPTSLVATRTIPGGCTESYRLALTFTGVDQFTGTFEVTFTGGTAACGDCVRQVWLITGTRTPVAAYTTFGAGCPGSLGVSRLTATQLPRLGTTLSVTLDRLPVNAAFLVTGWSNTASALGPLPQALGGFGMPGCHARVSLDATVFLLGTGNTATWSLAVPNLTSLLGGRFHQQALVLDPGLNALGGAASDAATATVGS